MSRQPADLAKLRRNQPYAFGEDGFFALAPMQAHANPAVRRMVAGMDVRAVLAAAVEAATGADPLPYPDADMSFAAEARKYCDRSPQAMHWQRPDVDLCASSNSSPSA